MSGGVRSGGFLPSNYLVASNVTHTQSDTNAETITGLAWSIGTSATELWFFEAYVEVSATTNAVDITFSMTAPSGATALWGGITGGSTNPGGYTNVGAATTAVAMIAVGGTVALGTGNVTSGYALAGKVLGGGTAGTVQLKFAQGTSSATDLKVLAGSYLRVTQLVA